MNRQASRQNVFALPSFRYYFAAVSVSLVGNTFTTVALAFAVLAQTHSVTAVGFVVAARQATQAALVVLGGAWADRAQRRTLVVVSYLGASATQAGLALLVLTGVGSTLSLMLVAACNGAVMAIYAPAIGGLLPEVLPAPLLQAGNAVLSMTRNLSNVCGALVAGALIAAVRPGWALAVDAATFLVAAMVALRLPGGSLPKAVPASFLQDLRDGWREVIRHTWVWVLIVQFAFFNVGYTAALDVYAPLISRAALGGPAAYGVIVASLAAGGLAGAALLLRLQLQRPLVWGLVATLCVIPVFGLFAAEAPLAAIVIAAVLSGLGLEFFAVIWISSLQTHISGDRLSRVMAFDSLGAFAIAPVGSGIAGPVAAALGGVNAGMWLAVATMSLATLCGFFVADIWRVSNMPAGPGEPPVPQKASAVLDPHIP